MARTTAFKILDGLRELGYSDTTILEHILGNYLDGSTAEQAMLDTQEELAPGTIDEDGYNHLA
jgi:hypothetical protein